MILHIDLIGDDRLELTRRNFLVRVATLAAVSLFLTREVCGACQGDRNYRIRATWRRVSDGSLAYHDRPCDHCRGEGVVPLKVPPKLLD